jgi:hypothetical protein
MSTRERHYVAVLQRLARGELTRAAASLELDVSERQVYRLVSRYRTEGDGGVVHRLRGRASNRGHGGATRARVLALYKQREYRDYGPQLFSEVLEERLQLRISSETVRQWLMASGLWSGRRAPRRHRKKRERRDGIGTLVQFDGSEHDWFEGRGPACCLLVAIDDASSRVFMRFAPSEDTVHVMQTLWQYVERYGIPRALYTDHGSVYAPRKEEGTSVTEVGRALRQLGVELIFANSPQAKGRVERSNRTHQDRLIKAMRHKGIATIEDANRYLDEHYLAEHNRRYACVEGKPDVHRTCFGLALEQIFCFETKRQVRNDYTLMLEGGFLQLERADGPDAAPLPPPKTMVTVRRWLDGSLHLTWNETELAFRTLEEKPEPKPQQRPPAQHPWRKKPVSETGKQTREIFLRSG